MDTPAEHPLEALGIEELQERAYLALVTDGPTPLASVARSLQATTAEARRALEALENMGLVSRSLERAATYSALPPDVALGALVQLRTQELKVVEGFARSLQDVFATSAGHLTSNPPVEVVHGRKAAVRVYGQMQQAATREICGFAKAPLASPANDEEFGTLRRGIRYRALYDRELLDQPGYLGVIRRWVEAGEEARVLVAVPMKLIIADDSLALIPYSLEETEVTGTLVVHPSALLTALRVLFETLWERAVPVWPGRGTVGRGRRPTAEDEHLLFMLASGFTDGAMARHLGVSIRTVQRKVGSLMRALGAETRFQLGLQARAKGWITPPETAERSLPGAR
jgi:sugar-specific transcriptional regulator TrmB/DNA-binding CsgD family transcriptional regulator